MDVKKPIPNKYVNAGLAYLHRKDTHSNQNAKGKRKKKAVKPKFHRLSFLKRGDVNKCLIIIQT